MPSHARWIFKQVIKGPSTQRGGGLLRVGVILALSIVIAGCGWFQELPVFSIVNDTSQSLIISSVRTQERGFSSSGESELVTLEPGARYEEPLGRGQCFDPVLIARTADGAEYAHEPHQMCAGDDWIVTGPDS